MDESRRTSAVKDVLSGGKFNDIIAYGGWPIDDHHPGGFNHVGVPNTNVIPDEPYGIPYRSIYSKNIDNLFFAGRNISASHVALSSTRVMATCTTLGQAVGIAAACAVKHGNITPREAGEKYIREIQQTLLDDDCFLLDIKREIPQISALAKLEADSGNAEFLRNGIDRKYKKSENAWHCRKGSCAEYTFEKEEEISNIRIVFDSNLDRCHLNIRANYFLNTPDFAVPGSLVKAFHIEADGKTIFSNDNNYQRLVNIPLKIKAKKIKLVIDGIHNADETRVFAFDVR